MNKQDEVEKEIYENENLDEIYCEECKKMIPRQFRFTDWNNDNNDSYGNWEECLKWYHQAVKEDPTGRYSIYAVTICDECDSMLEDEGILFNKNCEEYKYY